MPYVLFAAGVLLVFVLLWGFGRYRLREAQRAFPRDAQSHRSAQSANPTPVSRQSIRSLSPGELTDALQRIEVTPAQSQPIGAMCYATDMDSSDHAYVCPACGERTLYPADSRSGPAVEFVACGLPECRREVGLVSSLDRLAVELDESSFCSRCRAGEEQPALALIVTHADGRSHRTSPVSYDDLCMLRCFLEGKLTYDGPQDSVIALKDQLPRLRELLGLRRNQSTD